MKAFRIWCEWEMPKAQGIFSTRELAEEAINEEDWIGYTGQTLEEILEDKMVCIDEIEIK